MLQSLEAVEPRYWYRSAGLRIASTIALDEMAAPAEPGVPDVTIADVGAAWADEFAAGTTHLFTLGEQGSPWLEVRRGDGGFLTRWPEQLDAVIPDDGSRILVCRRGPVADSIPRLLLCQALSFALAAHGREAMHASAVEIDGRAVVVSGDSGLGKSVLATALCSAGGRLLADDLVSVRLEEPGGLFVDPTGTRMWLAPELAALMGMECAAATSHRADKVAVAAAQLAAGPVPLGAVYLLGYQAGETTVSAPLETNDAVKAFLGAMFNNVVRTPERLETQFNVATEIAGRVPVRIVRWQPGPDAARRLAAEIVAGLSADKGHGNGKVAVLAGEPNGHRTTARNGGDAAERRRLVEVLRAAGVADLPDESYDEPLLRTSQVATLLHSSDRTIRTWADAGKLPYIKTLGGRRMFPASAVMTVLQSMRARSEEA